MISFSLRLFFQDTTGDHQDTIKDVVHIIQLTVMVQVKLISVVHLLACAANRMSTARVKDVRTTEINFLIQQRALSQLILTVSNHKALY